MASQAVKVKARQRRRRGVRKRVYGTPQRPRLCVFRSARHTYAQIIDDTAGRTLAAACSLEPALRGKLDGAANAAAAYEVGKLVAEKALAAGVTRVVFDRSGYLYHGRVAALAKGAREAGLEL